MSTSKQVTKKNVLVMCICVHVYVRVFVRIYMCLLPTLDVPTLDVESP